MAHKIPQEDGGCNLIEHYTPEPEHRRVYTLSEAAALHHPADEAAARRWIETTRRRFNRRGVAEAGWINRREPVYYPEDLGLETQHRRGTTG